MKSASKAMSNKEIAAIRRTGFQPATNDSRSLFIWWSTTHCVSGTL